MRWVKDRAITRAVATDQRTCVGAISDPFGVHIAYSPGGGRTTIATLDCQWRTLNTIHVSAPNVSFAAAPAVLPLGHTADGRTYGSQAGGRHPDLVAALGTGLNGSQGRGYVAAKDIDGRSPSSPEQALRWNHLGPHSALLYAQDGNTIIGLFHGDETGPAPALTTYVATPPDSSPP